MVSFNNYDNNHYSQKMYNEIPIRTKCKRKHRKLNYDAKEFMDILIKYCAKENITIEYFILNTDNALAQVHYIDKHSKTHTYDMWCEKTHYGMYAVYSTIDIHKTDKCKPELQQLVLF